MNPPAFYEVAPFLRADDFFIVRHGWVWEAIVRLRERNEEIDYVTLIEELRQQNRLEEIGGAAYITYLINHTPSSIYTETYGRIVERAALRRRLLNAASAIAQLAHEESADIYEVIDRSEAALFAATERSLGRPDSPLSTALAEAWQLLDRSVELQQEGRTVGVPTGLADVDRLLGGLQKSDLVIIAGRPGMGKTSLLLTIALNAARAGAHVGIWSGEMSRAQLAQRLLAMDTRISTRQQRDGDFDERDWALYTEAQARLAKLPIRIDDTPGITPTALRMVARRWFQEHRLDLLVVDYLGLMDSGLKIENKTVQMTQISLMAKRLARELNVPVLAAAQLNREIEKRANKKPLMSDLRDSGSLEQDADVLAFLYQESDTASNQVDVVIAKHRNGELGTIPVFFNRELTQFANLRKNPVDLKPFNMASSFAATSAKD